MLIAIVNLFIALFSFTFMDYASVLYYILKSAQELYSPTFKDVRDAYSSAKLLGVPVESIIPDILHTNIAFLYVVNGKVQSEIYSVPSITVNILDKVREFEERGEDLIGFIHTHSPQSIMPSVPDMEAIMELQLHFPNCISAIKRQSEDTLSVFAFHINENVALKYFKNVKQAYSKMLISVEPDFVFNVPDVEYLPNGDTKHIMVELPVYDERSSTITDITAYDFLLQNNMLDFSSYNKLKIH